MANRTYNPPRALEKELVTLVGRIPLGADASVGTKTGRGFTVAKTTTGEYTVTLQDKYKALIGAAFSQIGTGTMVVRPVLKSEAVSTTPALIIKTVDKDGATADTSVAFDIFFVLHLRNSSVA